jgi:hypothetical protein
MEICGEMHK